MIFLTCNYFPAVLLLLVAMLATSPAHAFRCKSKIIVDGMHEQQVIAACGKPTTIRHLGYALQAYNLGYRNHYPGGISTGRSYPGYGNLHQQVIVTEYVYNFGDGGRNPGQFYGTHSIATDADGNIYTTETYEGKRLQRFVNMGEQPVEEKDQGAPWPSG